jgi:hypothetical protein
VRWSDRDHLPWHHLVLITDHLNNEQMLALLAMTMCELVMSVEAESFDAAIRNLHRGEEQSGHRLAIHDKW